MTDTSVPQAYIPAEVREADEDRRWAAVDASIGFGALLTLFAAILWMMT